VPELLTGLFLGLWAGVEWGFDPAGAMVVGGLAAVAAYMASCLAFPYRRCWWCGGDRKQDDGRGNYRVKRACWWCRDEKHNRRVGSRLMGRG
jgi:hypothetical protein